MSPIVEAGAGGEPFSKANGVTIATTAAAVDATAANAKPSTAVDNSTLETSPQDKGKNATVGPPACGYNIDPADPASWLDPSLPRTFYLHDLFPAEFLEELRELMWTLVPSTCSNNMYASRSFFRSPEMAQRLLDYLPKSLGYTHVCSDLRFIRYPMGGYIAPHVDGIRQDDETSTATTTSFLLYLATIPEGEGGETEFLTAVEDGDVVHSVVPKEGSISLFPHLTPHQGNCVGSHPKVLLRGDLY